MKKPNKDPKFLDFLKRKQVKIFKRRRKARLLKIRKEKAFQGKNRIQRKEISQHFKYAHIYAPEIFMFLTNYVQVIKFINQLEQQLKLSKPVFVDLENVKEIDNAAITVLLSVMFIFHKRKIKFNGNFPSDIEINKKLMDSQFFDRLYEKNTSSVIKKNDQIFGKGNKIVETALGYNIIIQASETIWKHKRMCKGIQRVLLELMQNTHAHAATSKKGEEYWWISVNHDAVNKKVSFGFVDYGQGIFESLYNKDGNSKWAGWYEKMKARLKFGHNAEILQKLLEGELHVTVTGQSFRGKGLPGIKQVLTRNQISNLHIISNNVFADVPRDTYLLLDKAFSGTFIYWELCYNNENKPWNI